MAEEPDTVPLCGKCKPLPDGSGYYCEVHGIYTVAFSLNAPTEPVDYSEPVRVK